MRIRNWIALLSLTLSPLTLPIAASELPQADLQVTGNLHVITVSDLDLTHFIDSQGDVFISVEVPQTVSPSAVDISFHGATTGSAIQQYPLAGTFPPGPDDGTIWVSFIIAQATSSKDQEIRFYVNSFEVFGFTRILLGRPSTPTSRIIGAFSEDSSSGSTIIRAGEDLLGTIEALQHIRFPAGFLGLETESFDDMVAFGEAPFEPTKNNVDTVMIRMADAAIGSTVPVRLMKFQNRTVTPIKVLSGGGFSLFEITARLSPNAVSGGFVTFNHDGTYNSTTSLYPVFEFQRVEGRQPSGDPIVIGTALQEVPGFPFYLASNGGRWTETPPAGRLVTPESSNFFYADDVNLFIHSNGGGGTQGACSKSSAASS